MKPSNTSKRAQPIWMGAVALSLVAGLALAGCAETLSNEHEPRAAAPAPDQAELERRAVARAVAADGPTTTSYSIRYIHRPSSPAGTPAPSMKPNEAPPGFYQEQPYAFAPGCECNVSAATLDVAIPCGQSACVNEQKFECKDKDDVVKSDACDPVSACQCIVDSDGAGPKGFAIECDTSICFEGRVTTCNGAGQINYGESCKQ